MNFSIDERRIIVMSLMHNYDNLNVFSQQLCCELIFKLSKGIFHFRDVKDVEDFVSLISLLEE